MKLVLHNRVITTKVEDILIDLRKLNPRYLKTIQNKNENLAITCPFHKDGQEHKPSCFVYTELDEKLSPGTFHCFTCGEKGNLVALVSKVLNTSKQQSEKWLISNYSNTIIEDISFELPDFIEAKKETNYLDESILDKYSYFHPYQFKRGISKDIIKQFRIGYDEETDSITFPVWDIHNNLLGVTKRSVQGKKFYIPKEIKKPVYLLNYIIQNNITTVVVCEGQIDALVSWSRGIPAVALFGAGTTKDQIKLLDKSGIRHFILMYDNDQAGKHGATRLKNGLSKDKLITEIIVPEGKDIASMTTDEFYKLLPKSIYKK